MLRAAPTRLGGNPVVRPAGLSCTGPAACVAVSTDGRILAEIWVGGHWQITPTPSP